MKLNYKSLALNSLLIVIAMIASYSASRMGYRVFFARQHSAEMAQKIEELRKTKKELEDQIAEIQTKEAVEREAKERLNLKKPGEEVVVVVPQKEEEEKLKEKPHSFWEKIMLFFNR